MSMNQSQAVLEIWRISGSALTACLPKGSSFLFKCKSPNDLERLRIPLTLPFTTYPPASFILFNYAGSFGLWSLLRGNAFPPLDSTALESPAFAHVMKSALTTTTLAVHPAFITSLWRFDQKASISFWPCGLAKKLSKSQNALLRALGTSEGNSYLFLRKSKNLSLAILDTSPPPCPSNTAKTLRLSNRSNAIIEVSSMDLRQPCISQEEAFKLALLA